MNNLFSCEVFGRVTFTVGILLDAVNAGQFFLIISRLAYLILLSVHGHPCTCN